MSYSGSNNYFKYKVWALTLEIMRTVLAKIKKGSTTF